LARRYFAMPDALVEMFKHNLWANVHTVDVCSGLSDEQLDVEIPGTYGSIRSTLLHMLGGEELYVSRLRDVPGGQGLEDSGFTGFDDLRAAATQSGQALVEIAERGPATEVLRYTTREGGTEEITSNVMLVQAINHAGVHRTHINMMLTHLGVEHHELDGWAYGWVHGQFRVV
jgi:uncharacterized damage-inducible protein DinB